MSRHDSFREMLARRAELPPHDEADLRAHVRDCPECRQTADAYARQTALLRALPVADPPPALRAGVLAAVAAAPAPPRRWAWRPAFLAAPVALAAAAVLILFFANRPAPRHAVVAPPTATHATKTIPSPTPSPTARPRPVKGHPVHRRGHARPTPGNVIPTAGPGGVPLSTQVALLPAPTAVPPPTTGPAPAPAGTQAAAGPRHPGGTRTTAPPPTAVIAFNPTPGPRPTLAAPAVPTVVPLPTTRPTPIGISATQPATPTPVVIQPLPTPTSGVGIAALHAPTPTPSIGPAFPGAGTTPAPTPTP